MDDKEFFYLNGVTSYLESAIELYDVLTSVCKLYMKMGRPNNEYKPELLGMLSRKFNVKRYFFLHSLELIRSFLCGLSKIKKDDLKLTSLVEKFDSLVGQQVVDASQMSRHSLNYFEGGGFHRDRFVTGDEKRQLDATSSFVNEDEDEIGFTFQFGSVFVNKKFVSDLKEIKRLLLGKLNGKFSASK